MRLSQKKIQLLSKFSMEITKEFNKLKVTYFHNGIWGWSMNTNRISSLAIAIALLKISMQTAAVASSDETAPKAAETRTEEAAQGTVEGSLEKREETDGVRLGGALSFTYFYLDFSDHNKNKGGDMELDNFRLRVDGRQDDLSLHVEYQWYSFQDALYQGWVGYRVSDAWQWQLGVTRVPFGLLPYGSHSFLYSLPFYIGLEDDNDFGLKMIWDRGGWNLQLAFFKNAEWGNASKLERATFDVVVNTQSNEEANQLNGRLTRIFEHGGLGSSEVGLSGQWGGIYNSTTEDSGDMWAAAAHFNGVYGPLNLQIEAISYRYHPENPAGVSGDTIEVGAFGVSSLVASEAEIYLVNLAYDVPVRWGPIEKLTFYNDYATLAKRADFPHSHFNATGCFVSAGPLYAYVDYFQGKNALFLGGGTNPYGAAADSDDEWHARFNINVGYNFNF